MTAHFIFHFNLENMVEKWSDRLVQTSVEINFCKLIFVERFRDYVYYGNYMQDLEK